MAFASKMMDVAFKLMGFAFKLMDVVFKLLDFAFRMKGGVSKGAGGRGRFCLMWRWRVESRAIGVVSKQGSGEEIAARAPLIALAEGRGRGRSHRGERAFPASDGLGIAAAEGGEAVGGAYPLAAARSSARAATYQVGVHLDVVSGHVR